MSTGAPTRRFVLDLRTGSLLYQDPAWFHATGPEAHHAARSVSGDLGDLVDYRPVMAKGRRFLIIIVDSRRDTRHG